MFSKMGLDSPARGTLDTCIGLRSRRRPIGLLED